MTLYDSCVTATVCDECKWRSKWIIDVSELWTLVLISIIKTCLYINVIDANIE